MKKKEIIISTVLITTVMLMSAVGYSCTRQDKPEVTQPTIVEQFDKEVESEESAPSIASYEKEVSLNVGETLTLDMLKLIVSSSSDVKYDFESEVFNKLGSFDKIITVTDSSSGKSTKVTVKVTVVDKSAPVLEGIKNITITEGDSLNLLSGVSAKDNLDGDITANITVSAYNTGLLDTDQTVTYSVTDTSGNTSTQDAVLHIVSNPIESMDKTMYATSSVNVRDISSANGNKVGSLGYAQSVHVTGRDKNTGWYRIEFEGGESWVSDSYLSDSKPVVQTPSNSNNNPSTPSQPSDCQASDCDCTSVCTSVCDCVVESTHCDVWTTAMTEATDCW